VKQADLTGRSTAFPIFKGEPVSEGRLAPNGSGAGLASLIPPGMRAVAIHVNDVVGVAGFVVAGTHVDVLSSGSAAGGGGGGGSSVSGSPIGSLLGGLSIGGMRFGGSGGGGGGGADTVTKTILQNITVLSAGQDYKQSPDGKPITVQVVNLLVTPQQAEMLSLASNETTIQLILRNPGDKEPSRTRGVTLSSILADQPTSDSSLPPRPLVRTATARPKPQTTPKESTYAMEIIVGNKRTIQTTGVAR